MDLEHRLDDIGEDVVRITKNATLGHYMIADFTKLGERIDDMKAAVANEIVNNKIASDSPHGWWTVKYYEANPIFTGPKAEEDSKKLYQAQQRAGREIRRIRPYARGGYRGGNRGFRGGFTGRGNFSGGGDNFGGHNNGHFGGGTNWRGGHFGRGGGSQANMVCFTCHEKGHSYVECPKTRNK